MVLASAARGCGHERSLVGKFIDPVFNGPYRFCDAVVTSPASAISAVTRAACINSPVLPQEPRVQNLRWRGVRRVRMSIFHHRILDA